MTEPVQLGLLDQPTVKPQPEPEVEVPCSQLTELPGETWEDLFTARPGLTPARFACQIDESAGLKDDT